MPVSCREEMSGKGITYTHGEQDARYLYDMGTDF